MLLALTSKSSASGINDGGMAVDVEAFAREGSIHTAAITLVAGIGSWGTIGIELGLIVAGYIVHADVADLGSSIASDSSTDEDGIIFSVYTSSIFL